MRNIRNLSVEDIEKAIMKLLGPNEGIYPSMLYDLLEKISKERYEEKLQSRCNGCGKWDYCNCWEGVR